MQIPLSPFPDLKRVGKNTCALLHGLQGVRDSNKTSLFLLVLLMLLSVVKTVTLKIKVL